MARSINDAPVYLETDVASDPELYRPNIIYVGHSGSVSELACSFNGLQEHDLPDGEGRAIERIKFTKHNRTHLIAPYHFASTMNRGECAISVDEVPLKREHLCRIRQASPAPDRWGLNASAACSCTPLGVGRAALASIEG